MQFPDFVKSGDYARLFPVISDTRKEQRVTSVFLAVLSAVPQFANAVLAPLGQKISKSAVVNTFIETELAKQPTGLAARPDGLIEIKALKKSWYALIESKIGNSVLDAKQVETYLQVARDNSVDALVTISNQFTTRPKHHPLRLAASATRKVDLFHLSWKAILTEAMILHESAAVSDPEQAILLREFIHFLSHQSVGVSGYVSMPPDWKDIVALIQAGAILNAKDPRLEAIVTGWHQEIRDLSLMMGRILGQPVELIMTRTETDSIDVRIRNDIETLCRYSVLNTKIGVTGAASDILVVADLRARNIRASMKLEAPKDKKSTLARVNWMLRQLKEIPSNRVTIHLDWPARSEDTVYPLEILKNDPTIVKNAGPTTLPKAIEVVLSSDSGRRFGGRQTFIEDLEKLVPEFYENIGQHLRPWQATPPKPRHSVKPTSDGTESEASAPKSTLGNEFARVSYIPEFWKRLPQFTAANRR